MALNYCYRGPAIPKSRNNYNKRVHKDEVNLLFNIVVSARYVMPQSPFYTRIPSALVEVSRDNKLSCFASHSRVTHLVMAIVLEGRWTHLIPVIICHDPEKNKTYRNHNAD